MGNGVARSTSVGSTESVSADGSMARPSAKSWSSSPSFGTPSARGQNLSARRYTFGQWLDEWFAAKQRQGTRATTLRGYEWLIRQHIRPVLGGIRLDKLCRPTSVTWSKGRPSPACRLSPCG